MAVTLNANTSTGFIATSDTSGVLQLQTGGTTAVTVDASQQVGIGTASPGYKLDVSGVVSSNDTVRVTSGTTVTIMSTAGGGEGVVGTSSNHALQFRTNNTEAMRIDSSGNVGINSVSPSYRLEVNSGSTTKIVYFRSTGTNTYTPTASTSLSNTTLTLFGGNASGATTGIRMSQGSNFELYMGGVQESGGAAAFVVQGYNGSAYAERMRIDSGGNLLVGTTGQIGTEKIGVEQTSTTGQAVYCYAANASYAGNVIVVNTARAASTAFTSIATYSAGVNQFYVGGTGLIYSVQLAGGATTLSVNASGQIIRTPSDASLKTNVQPITYGLDTVMKLKPIKHDWVEEINMGAPSIGFIAQDMELEVPEVVSGEKYKSIDYPKLTAVLTKAIQEQQAIITSLTDRITALEGAK